MDSEEENNRQKPDLLVGIDRRGQLAWLGETDSAGFPVGYIDRYRQCWINVTEHDLSQSARVIHRQVEIAGPGRSRGDRRSPNWSQLQKIAQEECQKSTNWPLAIISGLAAISYSRRLGHKLQDPLLAQFLVDSILGRQRFSSAQELEAGIERWLDSLD